MESNEGRLEVVGLLPAAGQAARIAPLPCSKELYPVGFRPAEGGRGLRPKVASHYLLESMRVAGIKKVYVILREGKWDIPAYYGDGTLVGMHLAYLMMRLPFGAPYTIDQAYPFVRNALVATGFPDVIFRPGDAYVSLLAEQAATRADIVLGLFPTDRPDKADVVDVDGEGRVRRILIKPPSSDLRYAWMIAVWTPRFTDFLHAYLGTLRVAPGDPGPRLAGDGPRELFVGDVIQAAIREGLPARAVRFPAGSCLDIGTPDDLARAVRLLAAGTEG